ncbi:hypothetical protein Tco_1371761, partial [Tanacetum coccineum]
GSRDHNLLLAFTGDKGIAYEDGNPITYLLVLMHLAQSESK